MKYLIRIFVLFVAIALSLRLSAQQPLILEYNCRPYGIMFDHVISIDNRPHDAMLGYVQAGLWTAVKPITFEGRVADSLAQFFRPEQFTRKDQRTLVMILNELFMSEEAGTKTGTLRLSLRLFVQATPDTYYELITLDSVYQIKDDDVSSKLLHAVSEKFCGLSRLVADQTPKTSSAYWRAQLYHLDSLELLALPMYVQQPATGVYLDYNHFKNNQPDVPEQIAIGELRQGDPKVFKVGTDRKGRPTKSSYLGPRDKDIYAVSDGQRMFRHVNGKYYEIKKSNAGFYYDRPALFSDNGETFGFLVGGFTGAAVSTSIAKKDTHTYRFKINARTGRSSPIAIVD